MNNTYTLPDNLFPAVIFLKETPPTRPIIFTILIYNTQDVILYVAWFPEDKLEPITVYKDGDKWFEKRTSMETVNSKAIGIAIENYNPFK